MIILVIVLSLALQLFATFYALYLIKKTEIFYSWVFISIALILMSYRRSVSLFRILSGHPELIDVKMDILGLFIAVFMVLGVSGLGAIFEERKKNSEKISLLLKEKENLLRETHHRVKNNMNIIQSLLGIYLKNIKCEEDRDVINEIRSKILLMERIYSQLLKDESYTDIEINKYLTELIQKIREAYSLVDNLKIKLQLNENIKIKSKNAYNFGLIINELITNSIKYAFKENDNGLITIEVIKENNNISIKVRDNGKGIGKDFCYGVGLNMINAIVKQYEGEMKIYNDNGTVVEIEIDYKKLA